MENTRFCIVRSIPPRAPIRLDVLWIIQSGITRNYINKEEKRPHPRPLFCPFHKRLAPILCILSKCMMTKPKNGFFLCIFFCEKYLTFPVE